MNGEKKKERTLRKDILLIVLGFALATAGQWFWQVRGERQQKLNTAFVLRQSVVAEMNLCQIARASITNLVMTGLPQNTRLLPEAFDTLHSPSLYFENRSRSVELKPEIVDAVIKFDFALQQAKFMREFNRKALELSGGDIGNKENSGWQAYLVGLDRLCEKGRTLVDLIDKEYPSVRSRAQP